ncbi:hypothetical protein [Streptomyces tremellae]|uniref:Uncharacterized protein n=1 Tax=Streptomyces tremellae TaxID=1124239 RepID=A0ABP7EFV2_9ACTN
MSARQTMIGALFVDSGLEPDPADPTGRLRRIRPPRAGYACYLCGARLGPVHGRDVPAFVADTSISHRATCPATTTQGATAA